jgi:Uri superfamily endonuclease
MRGTYALVVHLPYSISLSIGSIGRVNLERGFYVYVGSALGGVERRVGRHLSPEKKVRWHIDHLLLRSRVADVVAAESPERKECEVAGKLARSMRPVPGFGSTDCRCETHLFYCSNFHEALRRVLEAFKASNLRPAGVGKP